MNAPRILFCNCTYAQVLPREAKEAVLRRLCESAVDFDAVADLCEMSARQAPELQRLAGSGQPLKIAACYPRAVKWLFASARAPLAAERTEILNLRVQTADAVAAALLEAPLAPNLPPGSETAAPVDELPATTAPVAG